MPSYTTLIQPVDLATALNSPDWVILDCRFNLMNSSAGRALYEAGHLPNAQYADLEQDLSSPKTANSGRHPLPPIDSLVAKFGAWGIDKTTQVVVYDDANGAFAGRAWWLLRWLGHQNVAVLNGGIQAWTHSGYELTEKIVPPTARQFVAQVNPDLMISTEQLAALISDKSRLYCLLDARAPERYRGEVEPIDPIAGHIPTAVNVPFAGNLDATGYFLGTEKLRARFDELRGQLAPEQIICSCGSGVTACHNLIAMEHAGLKGAKLYVGSWSEWITDPQRPIVTGA